MTVSSQLTDEAQHPKSRISEAVSIQDEHKDEGDVMFGYREPDEINKGIRMQKSRHAYASFHASESQQSQNDTGSESLFESERTQKRLGAGTVALGNLNLETDAQRSALIAELLGSDLIGAGLAKYVTDSISKSITSAKSIKVVTQGTSSFDEAASQVHLR